MLGFKEVKFLFVEITVVFDVKPPFCFRYLWSSSISPFLYALVLITNLRDTEPNAKDAWVNFLKTIETKISIYETVEHVTPALLQFSLETSLKEFLEVSCQCKQACYLTKTLFFKKLPQWLTS